MTNASPHVELDDIGLHSEPECTNAIHMAERIDDLGRIKAKQSERGCLNEIQRRDSR